ncbi:uronyl 2-sulfotransferase homolog pip-like [Oratosquilla oratoria]|uniref:uronyl 2-sulfotransferase homolog pip-like n=1 Tax=Oratosquilla oratoria TaxID=337810 RepID=UPI003F75EC1D
MPQLSVVQRDSYQNIDKVDIEHFSYLRKMSHPPKSWFEKDINTCLLEDDPECSLSPGKMREMMITFFCGQHPACMEIGNVGALQRAKRHVENYYSVVGIMEEFELSFKVLEGYVPRFFKGAAEVFRRNDTEMHYNKGNVKYNITEETKERLRQMLALDIEFYEFVKQRLRLQAQNLDLV